MKRKKGFSITVGLLLGSFVCFFVVHHSKQVAPGMGERFCSCIAYPFLQLQYYCLQPVCDFREKVHQFGVVHQAYTTLLEERDALQAKVIELEAVQTWYEDTQEIRSFVQSYQQQQATLVRVLLKQFSSEGQFFWVNAGTVDGIEKDSAVVYKNCLVGKVSDVYRYCSRVILITDPRCKVAAYCNETKTQGIYEGIAALTHGSLSHVDHLSTLQDGELVASSGEGFIFPRGFGLGTISSFSKQEGAMHYTVEVKPLVDLSSLSYCYILEKKIHEQHSEEDKHTQLKQSHQKRVEQLLS